jgi:hypothetical protein
LDRFSVIHATALPVTGLETAEIDLLIREMGEDSPDESDEIPAISADELAQCAKKL